MKARLALSNQKPASSSVGRAYVLSRQFTNRASACSSVVLYLLLSLIGNAQTPGTVDLSFDVGRVRMVRSVNLFCLEMAGLMLADSRLVWPASKTQVPWIRVSLRRSMRAYFALELDGKIVWAFGNAIGRLKPSGSSDPTFQLASVSQSGAA